jgi:uncharacterized iron-regulated membrane protein
LNISARPNQPYQAWMESPGDKWTEAFINPYTGKILGDRAWDATFFSWVYKLHYQLLAGDIGTIVAGIAALLWVILSLTGIALWPGWRKLINGFKIKWNAHPQRVNFDIHKVTGIVFAVFLAAIAFTGFCWNFYEKTEPLIYAATFTPKPPEPVSKVIPNQSTLALETVIQKSAGVIPDTQIQNIQFPQSPEGVFSVRKKPNQSPHNYGQSSIYLDQYTGEILQVNNELKPSRADAILNAFMPIHYGTFWGLPSRIFYLFVAVSLL